MTLQAMRRSRGGAEHWLIALLARPTWLHWFKDMHEAALSQDGAFSSADVVEHLNYFSAVARAVLGGANLLVFAVAFAIEDATGVNAPKVALAFGLAVAIGVAVSALRIVALKCRLPPPWMAPRDFDLAWQIAFALGLVLWFT